MKKKKTSTDNPAKKPRRAKQKGVSLPVRYRFLMIACALCLIAGFFFAARQHFSSIDFSIKNSRLRKMGEELESDKRRLLLTKEIALSPTEIKKAAQKIGFKVMNAGSSEIFRSAPPKAEKTTDKSDSAKPKQPAAAKISEPAAAEKAPAKKVVEEKSKETKIKREAAQTTR